MHELHETYGMACHAAAGVCMNGQAVEDIISGEAVVNVPIKLTMCRISARNVLIKNKGKYLGEELKKTFEKNEVGIVTANRA